MTTGRRLPTEPLGFNSAMRPRTEGLLDVPCEHATSRTHISRDELFEASETYEIIESYPEDKYLPSYLVWATSGTGPFHVLGRRRRGQHPNRDRVPPEQ